MSTKTSSTGGLFGPGMIVGANGGGSGAPTSRPSTSSSASIGRSPLTPSSESSGQLYGNPPAPCSSSACPPTSGRLLTVSVVGWSGTEKEKGSVGVGKSCLCNRFVRPLEDDYRTDHISTLSQVDFGGRVINNDHWLYWGERTLFMEDACELTFRVLEHTEFVDDESFQPLKASSTSQREPYVKRCAASRLQSADKLMYISKEQLGIEHEYEQRPLPDGKASVDGFLCVYDVGAGASHHRYQSSGSSSNECRQMEFVSQVLQIIIKTRKPVVLVTTKNDEVDDKLVREAERLLQSKKEFKNSVPLIECSSHKNVNVEAAFVLLASLIDRQQRASPKPKILPYAEAYRNRREILDVAAAAYMQKLKSTLRDDHRVTWTNVTRQLADDPDFVHFRELCGTAAAQRLFKQHVKELREKYNHRRLQSQIGRLPDVMPYVLPDASLVRGKSWQEILQALPSLPHFDEHFQPLGSEKDYSYDNSADYSPGLEDPRIPAELLFTQEAENCFRHHVTVLEAEHRRKRLQEEFAQLIAGCSQVTPGKPLSDVRIFFLGKECFESLPEGDLQVIYDRYQNQVMQRARRDFVELLLEQVEEFVRRSLLRTQTKPSGGQQGRGDSRAAVGPPRSAPSLPGLNERDWRELHEKLQEDGRYRQLNRLHQSRDSLISQYISFVSHPLRHHCPSFPRCADALVEQLLANRLQRDQCQDEGGARKSRQRDDQQLSFPPLSEQRMNLLVLGTDGLAEQVIRELRAFLPNDLFFHQGTAYNLDYCSVENDDAWTNTNFQPNGLMCAFSTRQSLDYVRNSINRALMARCRDTSLENGGPPSAFSLRSLPVVLLFAFDPSNLDDLPYLQQQGAQLADQWQCQFVGLEPSDRNIGHVTQDRRLAAQRPSVSPSLFTIEQLNRSLTFLLMTAVERTSLPEDPSGPRPRSRDPPRRPDASLTLCLMCGDDYSPELILGPLLNYQCDGQSGAGGQSASGIGPSHSGAEGPSIPANTGAGNSSFRLETFSPGSGRKLRYEINVASYHTAFIRVTEHRYNHGYILVYTAKRRASLAHLHSLAQLIPDPIPILVVAVGEVTEFFSDPATNSLITEGNEIADRVGARFITISRAAEQQLSIYTPFFDEVWSKVNAVESAGFVIKWTGHCAPSEGPTCGQHEERENQWYGRAAQQDTGEGRPPPPPYADHGNRQWSSPGGMSRSTYWNDNGQRLGHCSPQSQMYPKGRLSESCLSVTAGTDHSSTPSPSGPAAPARFDDAPITPRKSVHDANEGPCAMDGLSQSGRPARRTSSVTTADQFARRRSLTRPVSGQPPSSYSNCRRRHRFGSSGDEAGAGLADCDRHAASTSDISEVPAADQRASRWWVGDWRKAFREWWDGGVDGPPGKVKNLPAGKQAGVDKLQRSGSAASGSPRSLSKVPGVSVSPAGGQQQHKKFGRINLQNVTESISWKLSGRKTSAESAPAVKHNESVAAPLATPESIELGAEYMTVKDALGGCYWLSNRATADYGDDEQQYATVDSILGAAEAARPSRRAASSGDAEKRNSPLESVSSGDSSERSAYDRAGRKPTPHRCKQGRRGARSTSNADLAIGGGLTIAERVRQLNAALEASPPPLPPYTNERMVTVTKRLAVASVLAQRRSASEESLLDPFLRHRRHRQAPLRTQGDVFGPTRHARRTKTTAVDAGPAAAGFVRKVTSSFRFRRKKSSDLPESRSMPQSPLLSGPPGWHDASRVFVLPPFETSLMWNSNADGDDEGDGQAASSGWTAQKGGSSAATKSPRKDSSAPSADKVPPGAKDKKSSKDPKKSTGDAPGRTAGKKKAREPSQAQLLPAEATLRDMAASEDDPVPSYVRKCVQFIEATGLQVEGIYRVPGNQAHVMLLEQKFADDPNVSFYDLDLPVNAVATSLKNFFSSLNEPVVPYNLYDDLVDAMSVKQTDDRQDRIQRVLQRLPNENRAVLRYFLDHLRKVADHFDTTAMDHRNLAKCWWPTLLRPQFDSFETMAQMTQRLEEFVQMLLEHPELLN